MTDQPDVRQRMLDMASELAQLAVAMPPSPTNDKAVALGRTIVDQLRGLLAELPTCDAFGCTAPATHKTEYPLDRGGEWPHSCDAHLAGRETSSTEATWLELRYAVPLRSLTELLKGSVP